MSPELRGIRVVLGEDREAGFEPEGLCGAVARALERAG
jgi:hypothetical protein